VDLYEYQGKELFARFGIPTSEGRLATNPAEARAAAEEIGGQVVVKAQVLTGGRGKAGGGKLADDPDVQQRIRNEGGDPLKSTAAEYADDIDKEEKKWGALVRKLNLKVD